MKKILPPVGMALLAFILSCSSTPSTQTTAEKLRQWRRGVWLLADGSYAVYTDNHYFVISASGDSSRSNVYCGGSQIAITDQGIARRQALRIRKFPDGDLAISKDPESQTDSEKAKLEIDMNQFQPGTCNVHDHIIYDSVTEETDRYILLATCNGDREKIYSNGRSAYLPVTGGEFWAHRIESW